MLEGSREDAGGLSPGQGPSFGLCGRALRHNAELLHHRQCIDDTPVLAHETVAEAKDVNELHVDAPAGCRDAHELALVGPRRPHSRDSLVTAHQDVFRFHAQAGERCEVHPEELLDSLFRRRKARRLLVLDEIVGQQFAESVDVSRAEQVVQTSHRGCVIHRAPLSTGWAIECTTGLPGGAPRPGGVDGPHDRPSGRPWLSSWMLGIGVTGPPGDRIVRYARVMFSTPRDRPGWPGAPS